ncbi:hypothetical protein [Flavobacterium sp.]|uniref:hypothetical protein n=1 Tax=Flavobacterium sp. TaxID=239 RepID=UPI0008B07ED8|nr:hypothetical protein [Flavobacterium sp.]OGS64475.1 MAG: hypothetical protein A2X21_09305 [Flavobacteria bacterium GWA2_35_26]HCF04471.1 hypothetical protein [Flavobacterium sp.]
MNHFYKQPKILVWIESIVLLVLGFVLGILIIVKGNDNAMYYLGFFLYVPVSQFLFTPIYKLTGGYTYYSPMLLGYMANDTQIDLHSGTSFDHLFVLRKYPSGTPLRNRILLYHLEGLLRLIQLIEEKRIPESVNIVGTSYFFNDRTLLKLGFQIEKASLLYRINLLINGIDLFWMYSLSQGKLAIPTLWYAKKASIEGNQLVQSKPQLHAFYQHLQAKQAKL